MKIIKTFRIAVMVMAYLVLSILLASAPVTAGMITIPIYKYTGNSFTSFSNTANLNYTNISGSFEVSSPLASGLVYRDISSNITTWSFGDGQNTFSKEPGAVISYFAVSTSSTGDIVSWQMQLFSNLSIYYYAILESNNNCDISSFSSPLSNSVGYAKVDNNPGTWSIYYRTVVTSSLPEPASMLLLSAGLAGLWGFGRKFRG